MSDLTYRRADGVVWRVGPDRVLLHRIGVPPDDATVDLSGPVAFVWVARDEPGDAEEIIERVSEATSDPDGESVTADLHRLVDAGVAGSSTPRDAATVAPTATVAHDRRRMTRRFGSCFDVVADEPLASELIGSLGDLRVACDMPVGDVHRLSVRRRDGDWTVSWDDEARYSGPDLDLSLYDSLIAINVHAASVAAAAG